MSIDEHKIQFGKILDVSDTYHDMANLPDSFSSLRKEGRCLIDGTPGHNLKFIQKNLVSYESLFDRDPHLLLLSMKKDEEQSAVQNPYGNEGKTFTSYEDWVSHVTVSENQGIFAENVELFNVPLTGKNDGLFIGVTEPVFMIDAVNNNAFYDMFIGQDNYLETVATRWDQAPKKGTPTYVSNLKFSPCGETGKYIRFDGDYVVFYDPTGSPQEIGRLSKNCLQFLKIGVKNLCKTIRDIKDYGDVTRIVQENLLFTGKNKERGKPEKPTKLGKRKPENDEDRSAKLVKQDDGQAVPPHGQAVPVVSELSNDYIAGQLAKFITAGSFENIFNIKRSGDYGQIGAVHRYNQLHINDDEKTRCYLVTFDRLCFLRARFEHVPCIRVYQNGTIDISHGIINDDVLLRSTYNDVSAKLEIAITTYKNSMNEKLPEDPPSVEEKLPDEKLPEDKSPENEFITGLLAFTDSTMTETAQLENVAQSNPKEMFENEKMYNDSRHPLIFLIDYTYKRIKQLAHQVNNEIYTSLITLIRKIRQLQGMTRNDEIQNPDELSQDALKKLILSVSNLTNTLNFLSDINSIKQRDLAKFESRLKSEFEKSSYTFVVKNLDNGSIDVKISDTPNISVEDPKLIQLMGADLFKGGHVRRIMEGASVHFISDIEKLVKVKRKGVKPMSPLLVFHQILSNMIVLKSERISTRRNADLHLLANVIEDTFNDAIESIREERESLLAVWDKFVSLTNDQKEGGSPFITPHPPSLPYKYDEFGGSSPLSPSYSDKFNNGDIGKDEVGYAADIKYVKRKLFDEDEVEIDEAKETKIIDLTRIIERTPEECFYNAANALEQIDEVASLDSDKYDILLVKVALYDFVKMPTSISREELKAMFKTDKLDEMFKGNELIGVEKLRFDYFLVPYTLMNDSGDLTGEHIMDITKERSRLLKSYYDNQEDPVPDPMQKGGSPSFSTRPLPRGVSFKPDRAQGYYRSTEEVREMLAALSFKRRSRFF